MHKQGIYEKYLKRLLDVVCGIVAIVVFWWLYLLLAILGKNQIRKAYFVCARAPGEGWKDF